jgi:DNA (cytosine-5)-methyltransferase 1
MARAGLGPGWSCLFANDIDVKKGAGYQANWGSDCLRLADVASLDASDLPGHASLAWASFPCQDLSLAGAGAGLDGARSGTFWPFWKLIQALGRKGRAPSLVVLENVCGALSSHGGRDFAAIGAALEKSYRFGAVVVDAVLFVPQSRPRLFVVGVRNDVTIPPGLMSPQPDGRWHPARLAAVFGQLSRRSQKNWIWWTLPAPPERQSVFSELVDQVPQGVAWHTSAETRRLLSMMSAANRLKVKTAMLAGGRMVGSAYKRTRKDVAGRSVQRVEVRFDGIAGCLRTPAGGSSRQILIIVEGESVRSRLLSPREAARLMGLPDSYILPENYNDACHLAGDGVAVPVVRFLARNLLEPVLAAGEGKGNRAA